MGRCWNVSFTHDRSGKAREHPLHRKEFQGSLWSTRNDGSIARSLPSFARMVQGNANFSTLTVFFLFFGEIIGEGILLLILGYVEYMFYRFFFFLGITTTIKIFFRYCANF